MHASPNVVWLTTVIVAAVTIGRVSGMPTQKEYIKIIEKLLSEDKDYENVLSERIRLNSARQIPELFRSTVNEHDNVDPKWVLNKLPNTAENHSGGAVELSALIIGNALTCVMYKRYAFQLALVRHLVATETDEKEHLARYKVLAYVLPLGVDLLIITQSSHLILLDLYWMIAEVVFQWNDEHFTKDDYKTRVNDGLKMVDGVIRSTCVTSSVRQYHKDFKLTSVSLNEHSDFITDDYEISDKLEPSTIMELIMENEKAIMDEHQRLSIFWNLDMDALMSVLGLPKLQTDSEEFKRVSTLGDQFRMIKVQ